MDDKAANMKNKSGLAFSGGGYRATLFSLGTLWRLNMDGLLTTLDTITSLSGGAIAAAYLHYKWKDLTFEEVKEQTPRCEKERKKRYRATNFVAEVANPLLEFCKHKIDVCSVIKGMLNPFSTPAKQVAKQYDRYLFNKAKLSDIPDSANSPEFVFYATNYDTGACVSITRDYLNDYHLGLARGHNLGIAETISISSAFPPVMAPVLISGKPWQWDSSPLYKRLKNIDPEKLKNLLKTGSLWDMPMCERMEEENCDRIKKLRETLHLCDGGLYDNLSLEMLWNVGGVLEYDTVFSCDAGAPFDPPVPSDSAIKRFFAKITSRKGNWIGQLTRMIDVMINQQATLRKRALVRNYMAKEYGGAYWAIQTRTSNYPEITHPIPEQEEKEYAHLRNLPTQLGPFEGNDNLKLVNWGFSQADIALRAWYDKDLKSYQIPFKV